MMIRIHEIRLELDDSEAILKEKAARLLNIRPDQITDLRIHKKSVDARKKADIHFVYAVDVALVADEAAVLSRVKRGKAVLLEPDTAPALHNTRQSALRPVVVGFGPAGMFAALTLAEAGARPIVLERGKDADSRRQDVQRFWQENKLNPQSNVQFGEGGAGTFSDGKLTTGIKSPHCRKILETLYECGAPEDILYDAKPHIGTDRLTEVVKNLRRRILKLGGEVRFQCRMTKLLTQQDMVRGIIYQNQDGQEQRLETDAVILALGHSARDTITGLYEAGLFMEQKPFAVGARIEHPQAMIDRAQYGESAGHPALGAADYKLSCHGLNQRGAYTFCMCPGGTVVAAASEPGGVAVNGMSSRARDGMNANAALLVGIPTQTLPGTHPLAGFEFQRDIEQKAFRLAGGNYRVPAQLAGDFLAHRESTALGKVQPTCPTGVTLTDLDQCLPLAVTETMRAAILELEKRLAGFALPDAVLSAPETRSSSPVRILRAQTLESNIRGAYPCGEGAGYAGGIVSAAVDGMRCARAILDCGQ